MARETTKYILRNGRKIVYVGITDKLDRRIKEHHLDKKFTSVNKVGNKTTRDAAKKWEEDKLKSYRSNHKGKNPKYNKTDKG